MVLAGNKAKRLLSINHTKKTIHHHHNHHHHHHYPQVLLKECKYVEKKEIRHINDFSSSNESDEEYIFFDKYLSWLLFNLFIINT